MQQWQVNPEYKNLKNPWKEHHDKRTTQDTIKEILKDGTPDWYRFPSDFKNKVIEEMQYNKEQNNDLVYEYRMDDQEELTDFKSRNVNITSTRSFVEKLRANGIKCFTIFSGMAQTVGLWVMVPSKMGTRFRYITYLQTPAMIEWSVLRLDEHNLPNGEDYRGWRTVVSQLIRKDILTEERAHEIFGRPTDSIVSRRYRRTLHAYRHRRENVEIKDEDLKLSR